jgi:uncharacterized protein (DUF1697 family)
VPGTIVALIRGINVGRAKRVAMADLRAMIAGLGYGDVRTLLNSGNIVFSSHLCAGVAPDDAAARIQEELEARLGVTARVMALTAGDLAAIVAANPLLEVADNPSRLMVSFLLDPDDRTRLAPLEGLDWSPEVLALGARVAYLWCPEGLRASPLTKAVGEALGAAVTTRNWSTVLKLHALAQGKANRGPAG